jgi:hypothetical protein
MLKIREYIRAHLRLLLIVSLLFTTATIILAVIWWKTGDGQYEPFISVLLVLSGLIGVPSVREWISKGSDNQGQNNLVSFDGEINLDEAGSREFPVFYPKPFLRNPYLHTFLVAGRNNYHISEQREDGFIIVKGGSSSSVDSKGIRLKWIAKGEIA